MSTDLTYKIINFWMIVQTYKLLEISLNYILSGTISFLSTSHHLFAYRIGSDVALWALPLFLHEASYNAHGDFEGLPGDPFKFGPY